MQMTRAILILAAFQRATAYGQSPAVVTFDHSKNESLSYVVPVAQGQFFNVSIVNSCADKFTVRYTGIKAATPAVDRASDAATRPWDCISDAEPQVIHIPHDPKFGGYIVVIENKADRPIRVLIPNKGLKNEKDVTEAYDAARKRGDSEEKALAAVGVVSKEDTQTILISVTASAWDYSIAGGFTASWLTDPVYGVKSDPPGAQPTIFRDKGAEDSIRVGFAGFVHLYALKVPAVAVSLGLGINSGNDVTLFVGPSWRMGSKAAITAGWNLGGRKRLPNGLSEGASVADANALATLPTRRGGNFFVAFSYAFLSPGEELFKKPLAPPAKSAP